jgi:hypothetical protein
MMTMSIDRIDTELESIKDLLDGFSCLLESVEALRIEDREQRDLELLLNMRAKCEAIQERIERWYDGE